MKCYRCSEELVEEKTSCPFCDDGQCKLCDNEGLVTHVVCPTDGCYEMVMTEIAKQIKEKKGK